MCTRQVLVCHSCKQLTGMGRYSHQITMHCQGGIGFDEGYIRFFTFLGRPTQAR